MDDVTSGLTEEQRGILEPVSLAVIACPGAGKTRALMARYVSNSRQDGKGTALLSFTRRAVIEAKERSRQFPHLSKSPNFIGTFDSFLHHFIVTPRHVRDNKRIPIYVDAWSTLRDENRVFLMGEKGAGVSLDCFSKSHTGELSLRDEGIDHESQNYIRLIEGRPNWRSVLVSIASRKISHLNSFGIFDSASARHYAYQILETPYGEKLLTRLALRFAEVIVDEAQDCDFHEFRIMEQFKNKGIVTVVVCDPDQAIYEFRGADPQGFANYAHTLAQECRKSFNVNFRSSKAICQVSTSLRQGRVPIVASESNEGLGANEIYVLEGEPNSILKSYERLLHEADINIDDSIVLAHVRRNAASLAGRSVAVTSEKSNTATILTAIKNLSSNQKDATERKKNIDLLEQTILNCLEWPTSWRATNTDARLEHLGKRSEWLRTITGRVILLSGACESAEHFAQQLRELIRSEMAGLREPTANLANILRRPKDHTWQRFQEVEAQIGSSHQFSTIHGAKGGEWDAVLLAICFNQSLDSWEYDQICEKRRVLYVGASRARKLLAFAVEPSQANQVLRILDASRVPRNHIRC
jgi:superfamily I DNA/RNA helicase